jgi:RNA polymerase sigma-70 factor (ECF subfamily)
MPEPPSAGSPEDRRLVERLLDGDERAFTELVEANHGQMLRLARMFVGSDAVAEEVVQDAWIGILKGLPGFEARSALRTWIFRILVNIAKTRGQREGRTVPFSAAEVGPGEATVAPDRFLPDTHAESPGHWASIPASFDELPDARLLASETVARVRAAIDALPPMQAEVIRLRDVEGWSSAEVCNVLDLSETNQRVLLHRARSKVRQALERYLEGA